MYRSTKNKVIYEIHTVSKTTDYYIDIKNESESIIFMANKYNINVENVYEEIGYYIRETYNNDL